MPVEVFSDAEFSGEILLRYFRHAPDERWPALVRFIDRTRLTMTGQPDACRAAAQHQLATVAADGLLKYRGDGEDVTRLHGETLLKRYPPPRGFAPDEVDDWADACAASYFGFAPEDRWSSLLDLFEQMRAAMKSERRLRRFFEKVAFQMLALNLESDATVIQHAAALRERLAERTVH
ncbi:MAG: hypothetical protein GEV13_10690 [Rhodospirillales bacterium]|nr:hypothetical protein [Rhodospirillales bacterium]